MLPSLTALHVDAPKRIHQEEEADEAYPGGSTKRIRSKDDAPLVDMLESLQPELREFVLLALAVKDCKGLNGICQVNHQFEDICKDPVFWQSALRAKGWMPDWSAPSSPGGMTPKAYFEMVCTMNERHQKALLALRRDTTTIEMSAFADCTSLALRELPPHLTTIEYAAFRGCTSLALTHLPPNLTTIELGAFAYCTSLAPTHLPPHLTTIGMSAFEGCPSLAPTHFPPHLTTIEAYAFRGCTSLALTHLPPHLTTIEERAFSGCTSLALTHLPPNLTTIERGAFWDCTSLALTHLPPNLTTIGMGAFEGCEQLRGGVFEVAVFAINVGAF